MSIARITIKYNGEYRELNVADLDLNPNNPIDDDVKTAVSRHLGITSLAEYVVEPPYNDSARSQATVLNLRPSAVFGC